LILLKKFAVWMSMKISAQAEMHTCFTLSGREARLIGIAVEFAVRE